MMFFEHVCRPRRPLPFTLSASPTNFSSWLHRCVYQWTVALEDGEESGEDLPDPPACNAPAPKAPAGGEDGEDEEEADGGDDEEGEQPAAAAWSGDDEDLIESAAKVMHVLWRVPRQFPHQ